MSGGADPVWLLVTVPAALAGYWCLFRLLMGGKRGRRK